MAEESALRAKECGLRWTNPPMPLPIGRIVRTGIPTCTNAFTWLRPRRFFLSRGLGPPAFTLGKKQWFFDTNHTSIERNGCRLFFLAADYFPRGDPCLQ